MFFKAQDVFNSCPAETVNALVIVTNNADILIAACKKRREQVLHMVCILILVHKYIAEFTLIVCTDIIVFLQELHRLENNVVEIQCVVLLQFGLIPQVSLCNMVTADIIGSFNTFHILLCRNKTIFLLADH